MLRVTGKRQQPSTVADLHDLRKPQVRPIGKVLVQTHDYLGGPGLHVQHSLSFPHEVSRKRHKASKRALPIGSRSTESTPFSAM